MATVKDDVISAQGRILDSLIDCELRIAATYKAFAVAFPLFADFWESLAREERQHGLVLKKLHGCLARGFLFENIGRFDQVAMNSLQVIQDDAERAMAAGVMDASEAFAVALKLERSLIESQFYVCVKSDAPEFTAVCKVLNGATERHVAKLHAAVANNTAPDAPFFDRN